MTAPRRILVRATNWIGDAVMSEPALRALAAAFPGAAIDLLARPWVAPVYEQHPALRAIHRLDRDGAHRPWRARLGFLRGLARNRYDLGVLLPNSFGSGLELLLAGCRRRLGYAGDGRSLLLDPAVPRDANLRVGHEVFYYLKLVGRIGATVGDPAPRIFLSDGERAVAAGRLVASGLALPGGGRPVVGLNPGAEFGPAKRWPEARFRELAERLAARGIAIAAFGGPKEAALGESLVRGLPHAVNFAGATGLREFLALLSRLDAFVCNDSGPMHCAAALGVPTVAIFGSTDPFRTGPFGRQAVVVRRGIDCAPCRLRECPHGHLRCLTGIAVDRVEAALPDFATR